MAKMIARPKRDQGRLFPEISTSLYLSPSSEILRLASRPLSWKQRILGIGLDDAGRLACLLRLHREAFTAEVEGRRVEADFFWREFHGYLAKLWGDEGVWRGGQEAARQRIVEELFIDAHCAFYNGRLCAVETPGASDRAFAHADYVARLLALLKAPEQEAQALMSVPARLRIDAHRNAKAWEQGIVVCESVLERFPAAREFQSELVGLLLHAAFSQLRNGESEADYSHDAEALARAITRLESARKRFPLNPAFYEALAQCWQVRAIKLANFGSLAVALAAARRARRYDSDSEATVKLEEQLTELMPQLQRHVAQLQADLARTANATLTEKGQRMVTQAALGFSPMTQAEAELKAADIPGQLAHARAAGIWHAIGLPEISDASDERPHALLEALATVLAQPPGEPAGIAAAWSDAAASRPELLTLDRKAIERFLRQRLFPDSAEPETALEAPAAADAPVVEAAPPRPGGSEPAGYWLGSRQDLPIKLQGVAAAVLIVFAVTAYFGERGAKAVRDEAFSQLRAAAAQGADDRVMQSAEAFLGTPLRARDGREHEVRDQYDRSFSRWFVSRAHDLDARAEERVARYRVLAAR